MPDLVATVGVIDGEAPRNWLVFAQKNFGKFLEEVGHIGLYSANPHDQRKITVSVLLDDPAKWKDSSAARAVIALIVDGTKYKIEMGNRVMTTFEHVLRLVSNDKLAYCRHYGLRIWLMQPDRASLEHHSHEIMKTAVAMLNIDVSKINFRLVDSFDKAEIELRDLAVDLLAKMRLPRPLE
jgi:hypothetical protein